MSVALAPHPQHGAASGRSVSSPSSVAGRRASQPRGESSALSLPSALAQSPHPLPVSLRFVCSSLCLLSNVRPFSHCLRVLRGESGSAGAESARSALGQWRTRMRASFGMAPLRGVDVDGTGTSSFHSGRKGVWEKSDGRRRPSCPMGEGRGGGGACLASLPHNADPPPIARTPLCRRHTHQTPMATIREYPS